MKHPIRVDDVEVGDRPSAAGAYGQKRSFVGPCLPRPLVSTPHLRPQSVSVTRLLLTPAFTTRTLKSFRGDRLYLTMAADSRAIILRVVNRYIGVQGGYLGDFSYRTHSEFYPEFCGLDIDPSDMPGTTRERFVEIFCKCDISSQSKILQGVLARFPVGSSELRTPESVAEVKHAIRMLEAGCGVPSSPTRISSTVVDHAIADAEALLRSTGATSGVDRMHTAFHGFLRAICQHSGIAVVGDASVTALYGALRKQHPRLSSLGVHGTELDRILKALAAAVDSLNTLRNLASVAHPNEHLLQREEAYLYVNTVRTLMAYLDAKLGALDGT